MAAKLKFGNVLLCEHVVGGSHNKHTLINVYSGDVLLSAMPASLFMGLYIEYVAHKNGPIELDLEMRQGPKTIANAKVGADKIEKGGAVTFVLPVFQIFFEQDTVFEVIASTPGYQKTKILSKRISKGVMPA